MKLLKKSLIFLSLPLFSSISHAEINKKYDVIAIGNALVDIISYTSQEKMTRIMPTNFKKGDTIKVTESTADEIASKMSNPLIIPGGSSANTMVDLASMGGKTAFNSIVADDELGRLFVKSLEKENVDYLSPFDKRIDKQTARCITFITPDKDRTFAVATNIIDDLDDSFIDYEAMKSSKIIYTDSSSLDHGGVRSKTVIKAYDIAKNNNALSALNLNNNYYIENYGPEIISLLPKIDILIGSENEAKNLFKTQDLETAVLKYLEHIKIIVITQEERGALIATKNERIHIDSKVTPDKVSDLNGAGDAFAAGFLYGQTHNYTLRESGELAAKAAAEIIYQSGARPNHSLKIIFQEQ
ncbi:MAG: adenosine kinase [Rickettsiales bacterium]|jgi:sugar/nucleoside kinase (ribokinase family)|nr:adenosine kinase [Rickettsiales bacterium]